MNKEKLNILLLGSGGREHAIAWKLAQSPKLGHLVTLPGNPGTAAFGTNLHGDPCFAEQVFSAVHQHSIDLVLIGPEAPLAAGVSDYLRDHGILVFGPSQRAAMLETSKVFAKRFMARNNIPTAAFEVASSYSEASKIVLSFSGEYVIKVSGLAAGKGVFLPDSMDETEQILASIFEDREFGDAGSEVIIEERLVGREVSVLAFSDGNDLLLMPPAQDHKRLLDGDQGPNTGGMGVFAPSPHCPPELVDEIKQSVLLPALKGMQADNTPYQGVLYAGIILTEDGPKVLEFNCRFGDPETQAILPLLDGDLVELCLACESVTLEKVAQNVGWKDELAVCVVLASAGYPGKYQKGMEIRGLERLEDCTAFQAGTKLQGDKLVTSGGRVMGVTATGDTLEDAAAQAYRMISKVHFEGMQYRRDISRPQSAYASAGVSIDEGNRSANLIKSAVSSTQGPEVLSEIGSFGGLYDLSALADFNNPVLVGSTDGVGTKVILAAQYSAFSSVGHDIVNHCINDILVQGAFPLFFLDYYASSKLIPEHLAEIVEGIAEACSQADMALLGGETAEMPGVYLPGHFDLAGTIVGIVEKDKILPRKDIHPGDVLIGLASSGPHTNGYSLIRKTFAETDIDQKLSDSKTTLHQALLEPHRSYLPLLKPILQSDTSPIKALAHITGGGFFDNIPRVLPAGCGAEVEISSWETPEIFEQIQKAGNISKIEMYRVFNMGVGMVVIISADDAENFQAALPEQTWRIGRVTEAPGVRLV